MHYSQIQRLVMRSLALHLSATDVVEVVCHMRCTDGPMDIDIRKMET